MDVTQGQLLDLVPGRDAAGPTRWLLAQPEAWRQSIDWGVLDLSGAYRRAFDVALPHAGQVADPFHVIRLANNSIDEVRRRVRTTPWATAAARTTPSIGRGGYSFPPTNASPNAATPNSAACYEPATPTARSAWRGTPKKPSAASMTSTAPNSPSATPPNSPTTCADADCPPELRRLGRTLAHWHTAIVNWHHARVSNGPTEAIILWSVSGGVGDVADGHVAGGRGRVLWIVSLESAMLLAA